MFSGSSWPSNLPPSSMAFCAACASVMLPPGPETRSFATCMRIRVAAVRLRGDLLQLLDGIRARRVRRARVRVRRLAAARHAAPRQVLAGVSPGEVDLLPRHADHFGRDAVAIAHRLGAEVADARLDGHAAVRLDDEQAVVADSIPRRTRWSRRRIREPSIPDACRPAPCARPSGTDPRRDRASSFTKALVA